MKLTTSWINSYLRRTISEREAADALEQAGIEIEQFSSSKPLDANIVAAMVQKVRQHPEADRLHITEVFDGKDTYEVVCGAPNVREGLLVPFARVGTILPSGDVISQAKLRGVTSNGMLCSGRELELSDDHNGLMELSKDIALGTQLASLYPADGLVDIKTPANRWDVLSVLGLAREVAAQRDIELNYPNISELKFDSKTQYIGELYTSVSRFCIAEMTIDQTKSSPDWIVQRLNGAGIRSLGLIVDITNYVMLEYGQPLHAYDASQVNLPISVKSSKDKAVLTTLDGLERHLTAEDLVVADEIGLLGLAGVMGGQTSEVKASTKRIYLEAATFDGASVRKTAQKHGLRSEASARFERGLPVQLAPIALARAVELLKEYANGILIGAEDKLQVFPYEYRIGLRSSYASKLLGVELTPKEIVKTLALLEIEAKPFDIVAEAKSHLGKPYKWGATFRTDGTDAFDCSYFIDYLYSLIGKQIGHTASQLYESGKEIELDELKRGDTLYRDGVWKKLKREDRGGVSHVAMYIGGGKIIHAENYHLVDGVWEELPPAEQKVRIDDIAAITEAPGFLGARRHVENMEDFVSVPKAPWWRTDLRLEEDLIEELARVIGYDNIPSTIPAWHPQEVTFDRKLQPERRLRQLLSGLGLYEVMTYSFVSAEQILKLGEDPKEYLKLQNPLSTEQEYLRRSLAPSHLTVLEQNRKTHPEVGFYEISGVFLANGDKLPNEPTKLGITIASARDSYKIAKGVWDRVAELLQLDYHILPAEGGEYAASRVADIMVRGKSVGRIGQLKPATLRSFRLNGEVARIEVDMDAMLESSRNITFISPSKYPSANRDITVLVPMNSEWQKISKTLNGLDFVTASYNGDYNGSEIPEGYRSLSIRLQLAADDHTLSDDEVKNLMSRIEQTLEHKFKAKPRS